MSYIFDTYFHDAIDLTGKDTLLNAAQKNDDCLFLENKRTDRNVL
jgi:hypothetical protein